MKHFLAKDNSYSSAARTEALRRTALLPEFLGDPPRFELEVARIVALADNGHTALFPAQWTLRYPRSPVRLGLFSDGLYVIASNPEHAGAIGKRVVAINGRSWQEVRAIYSAFQGGTEGFKNEFVTYFFETPAILAAAGIGDDPTKLRLRLADGTILTIEPQPAPLEGEAAMLGVPMLRDAASLVKGPLPLYLRNGEQLYDFTELPNLEAAYIRLDAIGGSGLERFLEQSLERLRQTSFRNIILDLRFNMGGDLNRARDFAQTLPSLARGGHVYAITSSRTFSAAISTIGYLKQAGSSKVRIVGQPVGDRLEFWAEGGHLSLPGLGAMILHATERHNYRTGCPEADCHAPIRQFPIHVDSIAPDLPVLLTFPDFVAGRDPALEAIERHVIGSR